MIIAQTEKMGELPNSAWRKSCRRSTTKCKWWPVLVASFVLCSPGVVKASSYADLPDLSALTTFTTFGGQYNYSNVTVSGNVGISNGGNLSLAAPSTIQGNLSLGTGATWQHVGTVTGSILTGQDFTNAQNQVYSASAALAGLTADYTLGNVSTSQTFSAALSHVTVINMNTLTLGSGQNIFFSGGVNDYFILNIKDMNLTGNATIQGLGGVSASHVIVNFYDNSIADLGVVEHVDNRIYGTTLIPFEAATFHGFTGAIYSGSANTITLMSGAQATSAPFQPPSVPEPKSFTMMLIGFGLLVLLERRRRQIA